MASILPRHGADHFRRASLELEGHAGSARIHDPKFNDPVLGAQITGGSWSTMMNFDAMSRAGAAGRMALTEAAATAMGVPAGELVVRDSVFASEVEEVDDFRRNRQEPARPQDFTPTNSSDQAQNADQYTMIGFSVPQLDIRQKSNGRPNMASRHAAGHVYGRVVTPPVRYGGDVKSSTIVLPRRCRLYQGGHAGRQDRLDDADGWWR